MTSTDLARKLDLPPRCVVLHGTPRPRMKKSPTDGQYASYKPHYGRTGVPLARWSPKGEIQGQEPGLLCMECVWEEAEEADATKVAALGALTMPYDRPFAFVHLGTGNSKEPAPAPVASMLWEASKAFETFTGKGFLVALPVVSPGQMGSSLGRYVPLALYDAQGVAKWVHPLAKEAGLISTDIPEHQRYRSRTQAPALDMQAIADLYRETHLGGALKGRCIQHLTGQLVEAGATFEDARNQAAAAWDTYLATAQAKPASPPTSPEASEMATIAANLSAKGVPLDELQSYSVQRFATQLVNLKQLSPQEAEIQAQHAWAAYQASLTDHSAAKSTPNPPQPLPQPQHPDTVKPSASQPPVQAPAQAPSSSRSGTLFSKRVVPVSGRPGPAARPSSHLPEPPRASGRR